jgi:hypothetical protein
MRLIGRLLTYCTMALAIALVLVACKSPQQSSPPPTTPPRSSPPSSSPPPQPSQPSLPSAKQSPPRSQSTTQQTGKSSPPSSEQQKRSPEQARQQAAQTLKGAGEQVSKTAQQLPEPTEEERDPLIPDSESQSQTDPETSGDIRATQEALEQAGIAIQTAAVALETAETDSDLAEAEKSLARARVSVILAGQDLMDISDIFEGTPQEGTILSAEEALKEANVAIVNATDSVFDARIQLPEFSQSDAKPGRESGQAGDQGKEGGELDKELDDSIAIFEGTILDARNKVLGSTPPPTSAENVPGVAVMRGEELEPRKPGLIEQERNDRIEKTETEGARTPVPEDIPSPQGDDIVAQQLREVAAAETDPDLRAKLWDEYKKYKAGL